MDALQSSIGYSLVLLLSLAVVLGVVLLILYQARWIARLFSIWRRRDSGGPASPIQESQSDPTAADVTEGDSISSLYPQAVIEKTISPNLAHESSITTSRRQFEILWKYHGQGLEQSRSSFLLSLVFASLGFLIIATAIFTIDRGKPPSQQSASIIALLAGTIIDLVASLFFVQSRRAQLLMQEFFDKLRNDRKLDESLALALKVDNPELRSRLQVALAIHLAEIKGADSLLSTILDSTPDPEVHENVSKESQQP